MIYIDDVEVLGVDYSYELVGGTNFRNIQSFDIQGRISNFTNFDGVSGVWSGMSERLYQDWDDIVVMGVPLGQGKFTNISFPQGLDVREKPYSIKFLTYSTGDLYNLTGVDFNSLNLNSEDFLYINGFSESFSFNRDQNGVYDYSRDVSFSVLDTIGIGTDFFAKSFASMLFSKNSAVALLNAAYPSFYQNSGHKIYKETYNLTKNSYNFNETFRFSNSNDYIWTYTNSIQLAQNGVINISENGNVIGATTDRILDASGAFYGLISGGILNRINDIYSGYNSFVSGNNCNLDLINKSIVHDNCAGLINYSFQYSNDPSLTRSGYRWEYSTSIEKQDSFFVAAEVGNIIGLANNKIDAWNNAVAGWDHIKTGIQPRITGTFTYFDNILIPGGDCLGNTGLNLLSDSLDVSHFNASIGYQYVYSTDPNLINNDDNFYRISVVTGIVSPTHAVTNYNIIGYKEVAQDNQTSNFGQLVWKIDIIGKSGTSLQDYLNEALSLIQKPTGETYVLDFGYDYNPFSNTFGLNLSYFYNSYRERGDISIW